MNEFLADLQIPTIEPNRAKELDASPSLEELKSSVQAMQSNKAPGPDGHPIEFLEKFIDTLSSLLLSVFNESFENGSLPVTLTQASISLLLKGFGDTFIRCLRLLYTSPQASVHANDVRSDYFALERGCTSATLSLSFPLCFGDGTIGCLTTVLHITKRGYP